MKTALENLMSEPTVDSTEHISIMNLEAPPVITICPRQPITEETKQQLIELGYRSKNQVSDLFKGVTSNIELFMKGKIKSLIDTNFIEDK